MKGTLLNKLVLLSAIIICSLSLFTLIVFTVGPSVGISFVLPAMFFFPPVSLLISVLYLATKTKGNPKSAFISFVLGAIYTIITISFFASGGLGEK